MPSALSMTHGLRGLLLGAAIAAVPLLLPGGVSAAGPQAATADQAVPLTQPMSGHLDPNSAGSFAYYSFSYPGDQSTVTIDLNVAPDDPTLLPLTGFNVYGPRPGQVYATGGIQNDLDPDVSGNVISSDPGTYVVQVYNYNPQNPIDFTVWIDGMAAQPVTGTPAPAAVGDQRLALVEEVIVDPEGVEADRLGLPRQRAKLGPADRPTGEVLAEA